MGDEHTADPFDAVVEFNRHVSYMQGVAQRQQAREFAESCGMPVGEAYRLLARCQWSVTKARRALGGR